MLMRRHSDLANESQVSNRRSYSICPRICGRDILNRLEECENLIYKISEQNMKESGLSTCHYALRYSFRPHLAETAISRG